MDINGCRFPIMHYPKGRTIFHEGDDGDKAFLVKSGVVCVYRMRDQERVILAHLKAGQILGEMAIITGDPRSASAEAASACELVAMTAGQIQDALEHTLPFIRALLDQILSRYRDTEQKHLARTGQMADSLKEIRGLIRDWRDGRASSAQDLAAVLGAIDSIVQAALKKEKYVALVPRGYMQF